MRVLIVEDDATLAQGLADTLRREGYVADAVRSAEAADAAMKVAEVDLVLLDVGLPGMDGFSWLRKLRAHGGHQGVLVLTARDALVDRVQGLALGADDYLAKPFATEELVARVAALARRGRTMREQLIEHGALAIDLRRRRAAIAGYAVELSSREFSLLEYLFSNMGAILSKDQIAGAVSSWDESLSGNAVEVLVSRLRAKLEPAGIPIRAIRGLGYLVEPPTGEKP